MTMKREDFRSLTESGIVLLDGATGTNLQKYGMPSGVCPEQWILDHPDAITELQRKFVSAGTQILLAPTFTANRIKLSEYGLENDLIDMNRQLIELSKKAADNKAYVAADITMTGKQLYPMGTMTFEELVDIYKEQAAAALDAGADLFAVETMMSLQETRAAIIAIREICDLPIMATLTFESDGRTLFGTPPECVPVVLEGLGADAVGINCGTGPDMMRDLIKRMYEYSRIPIIAKPNAGMPELENGQTIYRMTPDEFAKSCSSLCDCGAAIVGGCCGTTPEHIAALKKAVDGKNKKPVLKEKRRVISSERKIYEISDGTFNVIGERINPTGKKALQAELREGKMNIIRSFAQDQEKAGAAILDINVGTNGIDEKQTMLNVITEVSEVSSLPLCIDSSYPEVIEAALRIYPGRALINSISFESEKLSRLLPVAKKYGAMFIFLPVSDEGIPSDIKVKHGIIEQALICAEQAGLDRQDIVVDALVGTVGADRESALKCISTWKFCQKRGLATVCGLSNISFGLPERSFVNAAFLVMGISNGLNLAIANPSQELLMNSAAAASMLMAYENSDIGYIKRMEGYRERAALAQPVSASSAAAVGKTKKEPDPEDKGRLYKAVIDGDKANITELTKEELAKGAAPSEIINGQLIPAINKVGEYFNEKRYFLPQLIASAGTMEKSIEYLTPLLTDNGDDSKKETIIIATVQGDVHDIGKNLVALMLRNYGYNVIDLGKDVPADTIIDAAIENNAAVVALSALMTTTMMNMKDVVIEAKNKGYGGKIIIGGACVTESFAKEIGADGYSGDAADCVALVKKLLA